MFRHVGAGCESAGSESLEGFVLSFGLESSSSAKDMGFAMPVGSRHRLLEEGTVLLPKLSLEPDTWLSDSDQDL